MLGAGLGIDAVTVVAMSAGAAMVGSAFGPTNPFQAGIALKLAELPPLSGGGLRLAMFVVGVVLVDRVDDEVCGSTAFERFKRFGMVRLGSSLGFAGSHELARTRRTALGRRAATC